MAKKISVEEYIFRARKIHNGFYKYPNVKEPFNARIPVPIECPIHGEFLQNFDNHNNKGKGCRKCFIEKNPKKDKFFITNKEFVERLKKIYGDKILYDKIVYKGMTKSVLIGCSNCGHYNEKSAKGLMKYNSKYCNECYVYPKSNSKKEAIAKLKKVWENTCIDFSNLDYINANSRMKGFCSKHNLIFEQIYYNALNGRMGCKKCRYEESSKKNMSQWSKILARFKEKHGTKYDYKKFIYEGMHKKGIIGCPKHGDFEQEANAHAKGSGCKKCFESFNEGKIRIFLEKNKFKYEQPKRFENCKDKGLLSFDFCIYNKNSTIKCLIEFNGRQHYELTKMIKNKKFTLQEQQDRLKYQIRHDEIKRNFCEKNNIKLIIIPYYHDYKIEKILQKELFNK